ncbi:MAG TPA: RsmE family RNA methyltransferase [Thermoanaerobaculia bacterium]|jgi:16S rRNA (uracil1498-N3)-methyltransferase
MRHRIHVPRIEARTEVRGDEFHHGIRVVRVRPGEEVELFDDDGNMARGTVELIERDRAVVIAGEPIASRESPLDLTLAMAVIQLEKFELVLQKATELGVRRIVPLESARTEVRRERYSGKAERWNKIVVEAVKQSGRSIAPLIEPPATLEELLQREGTKILFDADAPPDASQPAPPVTILIGPEGGWSDEELALARRSGCVFQRLGPRRLRAETAAIAALSVIASRLGDL